MEKGNFGIRLSFYAVVAFIFVIMGWGTYLVLLAGAVIFAEKNEWASRQVIQAACLYWASDILHDIVRGIRSAINSGLNSIKIDYDTSEAIIKFRDIARKVCNTGTDLLSTAITIAVLVFCVLAIIRTIKGNEAKVPLASKFADWAYGKVAAK